MFKSIQWKVLTIFVLLIVSVLLAVGTYLQAHVSNYYHSEFITQMQRRVFTPEVMSELSASIDRENSLERILEILEGYLGRIGISANRYLYVLNGGDAAPLYSSEGEKNPQLGLSPNILSAMRGQDGDAVNSALLYMDYAVPILSGADVSYIVYVRDNKRELLDLTHNIFTIIIGAMLVGLFISVLLGFFLSRTIISAISMLKVKAEKLAGGDFEQKIDIKSRDEIGMLGDAFNNMADELKKTMNAVSSEKNKVETILLYMTDGIMAFDSRGEVIHINPAARKMLGISEGAQPRFDSYFKDIGAGITLAELLYLDVLGTTQRNIELGEKHIKIHFAPFASKSGVVAVFQDITEQEKLETARREFVANVSHELRTPLTTIKTYTETLLESPKINKEETEGQFLKVIDAEGDRMARIVGDLLTLSRLDYNKKTISKASFSLDGLISDMVKRLGREADSDGKKLIYAGGDLPPVFGDRDRLEQVFTNIIVNAIKYTPKGGKITVETKYDMTDAVITISDNGMGIPAEDLPRIFERFYRVDKARARRYGGTGLGLAIAKEIVEAHNGEISIQSKVNAGTTVTIRIPVYS